jgi:hypothetical protein
MVGKVYKIVRNADTVLILRKPLTQFAVWESATDANSTTLANSEQRDEVKLGHDDDVVMPLMERLERSQA